MMERTMAASATDLTIGPTVSWWIVIGITFGEGVIKRVGTIRYYYHFASMHKGSLMMNSPPALEVRPTVGLIPTRLFLLDGLIIDPSVSVPSAPAARPIAEEMALPELEPLGSALGK